LYFHEKISEWVNFYFFMRLLIFAIEYTNYNHNQTAKYFSDFYFNEFLLNEPDRPFDLGPRVARRTQATSRGQTVCHLELGSGRWTRHLAARQATCRPTWRSRA
jgi:hypothetical protein